MDKRTRLQSIHSESEVSSSTQRDMLRLSSAEQDLEDFDQAEPSAGYTGYVKTIKPKQRRGTQSGEVGKAGRKNQEGVRRFRGRPNR